MKAHIYGIVFLLLWLSISRNIMPAMAQDIQETDNEETEDITEPTAHIEATGAEQVFIEKNIAFRARIENLPEGVGVKETLWSFGDGIRTTGTDVTHMYNRANTYPVTLTITLDDNRQLTDTRDIRVFERVTVLLVDNNVTTETVELKKRQSAEADILLLTIRSKGGVPEALVEEDLTSQLIDARDGVTRANLIISWTSGSVGASALSAFGQHIRQTGEFSPSDLRMADKGIVIVTDTPFGVLAPSAQSTFAQLEPMYVILTRPEGVDLLLDQLSADDARNAILASPISHRILGTFSARTVSDISPLNFVSFGINYLVNNGVPVGNITLILMLPVIATILSFSRQVIGLKAFGIITPAMTTLSLLVLGLEYGLILFSAVLLAGTITRFFMRKLHLLYLPRMALVLTSVSISILGLFGLGTLLPNNNTVLSFSIFPILILTLLAEEFIAVQFKSGAKSAFKITAWTLLLSIGCYFIVSWELLRTIVISYPEVVLLAIPFNILLGRWSGLRITEYFRFRQLVRSLPQ